MRMELLIHGQPVTKKNSMRLVQVHGRMIPIPSKQYKEYEHLCLAQIPGWQKCRIDYPVNVACVYWMATKRPVDLLNLLGATMDILVDAGVLKDDNARIVVSHDGSRVEYDKNDPRVEITITEGKVHGEEVDGRDQSRGAETTEGGGPDQQADR